MFTICRIPCLMLSIFQFDYFSHSHFYSFLHSIFYYFPTFHFHCFLHLIVSFSRSIVTISHSPFSLCPKFHFSTFIHSMFTLSHSFYSFPHLMLANLHVLSSLFLMFYICTFSYCVFKYSYILIRPGKAPSNFCQALFVD